MIRLFLHVQYEVSQYARGARVAILVSDRTTTGGQDFTPETYVTRVVVILPILRIIIRISGENYCKRILSFGF